MRTINKIGDIRKEINNIIKAGKTIGFVPTMGYLHEGHLSLMRRAKSENDVVIISIFVNPTQFGPGEDLESYPRDLNRDKELAQSAGVDILFNPVAKEMYPDGYNSYITPDEKLTNKLCGESRPGHFKGVTTIVGKLFNIITPNRAYFGQKDAQQVAVIKKMVNDLNFDTEIVPCSIVREEDGLALSSRNTYLNEIERNDATNISKSLFMAVDMINNGKKEVKIIKQAIIDKLNIIKNSVIDYVEIVDANTLGNISKIEGEVLIALAVKVGKTRLIDNIRLEV